MLYRALLRPLLFMLPAETAHRLVMTAMRMLARLPFGAALLRAVYGRPDPVLKTELFGYALSSPIGLAAGLDKDADAYEAFGALGFGSVEVGTLTAQPQPGNPRPRLFRLRQDLALINRMGFNNRGAAAAAQDLAHRKPSSTLLGINIGKTKSTSADQAIADYVQSATALAPHADYLVINVSSPNTPGLRDLQAVSTLRPLLQAVQTAITTASPNRSIPLLVKIAPDLADADIDAIADLGLELRLAGIIAVNTTIARTGLTTPADEITRAGAGGLSGPPLRDRALEVLTRLHTRVGTKLVLISVGGVQTADDIFARLQAGASLVQLYTALVYEGPSLPARLNRDLAKLLRESR